MEKPFKENKGETLCNVIFDPVNRVISMLKTDKASLGKPFKEYKGVFLNFV